MKVSQRSKWGCLFLLGCLGFVPGALAQKKNASADSARVAAALNDHRFVFVPQQMLPMSGRARQLTAEYVVKLKGDTLQSYLPYFGRAYTAPLNSSQGPLDFTTSPVTYTIAPRKKGGWQVTVKPANYREVQQYAFTIFPSGSASLSVTSTNRQPISYNGYVQPAGQK